jgi:hypothetical protein
VRHDSGRVDVDKPTSGQKLSYKKITFGQ